MNTLFAIIPYKSGRTFDKNDPIIWFPVIQEFKGIDSEFADQEGLSLSPDFLTINTCRKGSAFTHNTDGYSWIRAEIYKLAKALGANEVWYVDETAAEEMDSPDFSFEAWKQKLATEKKKYVVVLTTSVLKGKYSYSYYHDDFSDIILERPQE